MERIAQFLVGPKRDCKIVDAGIDLNNYSKIYIGESCKYVQGDLPALMSEIRKYQPEAKFPVKEKQPELVHAH